MKIGIIQAYSQRGRNGILCECVNRAAEGRGHEVINFGCRENDTEQYSYVETALSAALLLNSGAVDFIVTGCSSGQGMALAMNALPGVICGYVPTPQDAFLFGRINGGNAASYPLGLGFGWCGEVNLCCTMEKLFDGPFGEGYPEGDAARKRRDTALLREINAKSKVSMTGLMKSIPKETAERAIKRRGVFEYILKNGSDVEIAGLINSYEK